ncbi:MAG: T9SS type A sorting domain-containing protein [Saprospiraceae bacterium]|nr:T9SS type A sorting domain-containing protein [Saprospiraceae bacterium]
MKSILIKYNIIQLFTFTFFVTAFLNTAIAQPAKKSVFTFPTTIGPNESEDWPYSIFMSSDCIHLYFAGFNEIFPAGCSIKLQAPVIGKFNTITNTLVWEKTYFAMDNNNVTYQSRGTFWSIFEYNGEIIATGNQGKDQCSNVEAQNIFPMILKADAITGLAHAGYPKFIDAGTGKKLNFIFPFTDNGTVTGIYGLGSTDDNKSVISFLNSDGTVDPMLGNQGYFIGPEKVELKRMIKVSGLPNVKYAFIGTKKHNANDWDVYVGGLSDKGMNLVWGKEFSETDLIIANIYSDEPAGDNPLCSEIPETGLEGWENNVYEEGWDLKQLGTDLFLSCKFDFVLIDFPKPCNGFNSILNGNSKYEYIDMALVKIGANDGVYESAINIGTSDAPDFFPEIEIVDGKVTILGARSSIYNVNGQKRLKTDGKLTTYDSDLSFVEERLFSTEDWDINCSFDMALNCEGELFVTGNNDKNDEDYYFYKFSNGCQKYSKYVSTDEKVNRTISQQETWSSSKKVGAKITIQSGGILTINNNAVIEFGASWDLIDYDKLSQNNSTDKTPKIVIESGGRLNLNGCTLRGMIACPSNGMWDGIEVRDGGLITMVNSPTIQDAKIGILVDVGMYDADGQLNPTQSNGCGQVNAITGSIIDCRFGIHFAPCNANSSVINGINFSCSGGLKDPSYKALYSGNPSIPDGLYQLGTKTFISSNNVAGISITGGSISGGYFPPALRGIGIASWNSRVNLNGGVNINNVFIGLQADANDATRFFTITGGNSFNANFRGIIFRGGGMHKVMDDNEFTVKYPLYPNPTLFGSGIGIYNAGSILTRIEDNDFTAGQGNNTGTIGIVNENSGSGASLIKKNRFNNIDIGDQTQKDNGGLNLWCNKYISNRKGWSINPQIAGVFPSQGNCAPQNSLTPENEFQDPSCQLPLNHIRSTLGFTYWTKQSEQFVPACNSTIVSTQGCFELDLKSGCTETILLTPGNVNYYFTLVPTLPDGEERQLLVNDLIRYYIGAGNSENIHTLLQNESNENYKMTYAMLLLNEGNITGAQAVVASLPISSSETSSFTTYFNVLLYAVQNNISLGSLPENKVSILETLVEDRTLAAYASQAILITYYGKEYLLPIETESGLEYRSKGNDNSDDMNQMIRIQPNPVSDILSLKINILQESKLELEIRSINGNLISTTSMNGKNFDIKLDVSQFNSGVYLLRLKDQSEEIYLNKFIKL